MNKTERCLLQIVDHCLPKRLKGKAEICRVLLGTTISIDGFNPICIRHGGPVPEYIQKIAKQAGRPGPSPAREFDVDVSGNGDPPLTNLNDPKSIQILTDFLERMKPHPGFPGFNGRVMPPKEESFTPQQSKARLIRLCRINPVVREILNPTRREAR
jgi:hypothetical protein